MQRLTLQEKKTKRARQDKEQQGSDHILCHIPPQTNDAAHLGALASFVVKH